MSLCLSCVTFPWARLPCGLVPGTATADTAAEEMVCSLSSLAAVLLPHPLLFNGSLSPALFAALPFPAQRNCFIPAGIRMVS